MFLFFIFFYVQTNEDTKTSLGAQECPIQLPAPIPTPCEDSYCHNTCFDHFDGKPSPPGIRGPFMAGNCLNARTCVCIFCCDVACQE